MKIVALVLIFGLSSVFAAESTGKIIEIRKQTMDVGNCANPPSNSFVFIRVRIDASNTIQLRIGSEEAEAKEILSMALTALTARMNVQVSYDNTIICGAYKIQQLVVKAE